MVPARAMFEVRWTDRAEEELAAAWLGAPDRNAVSRASSQVELLLARDPLGQGASRSGSDRLMFESPLAVLYRVEPSAHVVWVVTVRLNL